MPERTTKIPIALCITELEIGGAENQLVELAIRLDRERFEPIVYSLKKRPVDEARSCVPRLERAGVPVHFLDISGVASLVRGFFRLRRFYRLHRIRIAQSFLFHANILSRFAAWGAGVPVACRFSGIRVAEQASRFHLLLDRTSQRLVGKYVCVGNRVAEYTQNLGGISPEKIAVVPNGIEIGVYENAIPADLTAIETIPGSRKIILIGRLHRQKGFDWFLSTLPKWMPRADGWEVLIVGDGPAKNALTARLREADTAPFADRVHFTGWRPDVPQLLAASDVCVLSSRWEGMPNVVLQAMSARLPVLATDVEGVDELLRLTEQSEPQERQEQIVAFGDTNDFAEKLLDLIHFEEKRHVLGTANHDRVKSQFSLEKTLFAYQELYARAQT